MVSVTISGQNRIRRKLGAINTRVANASQKALVKDMARMDSDAKQSISGGSRSGKVYTRGSVSHQASAPGEFPKTDRGELVSGFFFNVSRKVNSILASLSNKSNHASYLEFKPSLMGGRPFMRPIFNKWKPTIEKNVLNAARAAIKGVSRG
jgi:hypothetical protein